ncbi:COesterase domain-containing protein [Aphelenchoides besseyi]|nr:COesterase domain-containing protein [Aphelenchoides besseyi]
MEMFLLFCFLPLLFAEDVQIKLTTGPINGYTIQIEQSEVVVFKRIRFAEAKSHFDFPISSNGDSEACDRNCLFVNVFASRRCVDHVVECQTVFWIHGGGFQRGSPDEFDENKIAEHFARHELIVVVPSYRVGPFGFLDLDDSADSLYNLGLLDLISALRWTQRELPLLGGRMDKISLFGHEAGASLAFYLLSSPAVEETAFHSAVLSSLIPDLSIEQTRMATTLLLDQLQCLMTETNVLTSASDKLSCLKNKSMETILEASRGKQFGPRFDSFLLPFKDNIQLYQNLKSLPMMIIQPKEVPLSNQTGKNECIKQSRLLGYQGPSTLDSCILSNRSVDLSHPFMHKIAILNHQRGIPTYLAVFAQTSDFNGLDFLVKKRNLSSDDRMLTTLFAEAVHRFISDQRDDIPVWPLANEFGHNYFWFRYDTNDTGSQSALIDWPHVVMNEFYLPQSTQFWLSIEQPQPVTQQPSVVALPVPQQDGQLWTAFVIVLFIAFFLAAILGVVVGYRLYKRWKLLQKLETDQTTAK